MFRFTQLMAKKGLVANAAAKSTTRRARCIPAPVASIADPDALASLQATIAEAGHMHRPPTTITTEFIVPMPVDASAETTSITPEEPAASTPLAASDVLVNLADDLAPAAATTVEPVAAEETVVAVATTEEAAQTTTTVTVAPKKKKTTDPAPAKKGRKKVAPKKSAKKPLKFVVKKRAAKAPAKAIKSPVKKVVAKKSKKVVVDKKSKKAASRKKSAK